MRDVGLIPGSGRSPGGGNGNALQYSCLENPTDRGAWQATVHGVRKTDTDTTEDWTWLKQLSIYRNYGNYCLEGKGWPGSRLLFDLYRWRPAYQCKLFLGNSLAPLKRRRKKKLGPFHVWQIYHLIWVSIFFFFSPEFLNHPEHIPERNKRPMLSLGLVGSVLFLCIFFVFSKVCEMMPVNSMCFTYLFLAFQLIPNSQVLRPGVLWPWPFICSVHSSAGTDTHIQQPQQYSLTPVLNMYF